MMTTFGKMKRSRSKKVAVYSASSLFYNDVVPSVKSMLKNGGVDEIVIMTQDDALPYETPENVKVLNVSGQPWFKPESPNYRNKYAFICLVRVALAKLFPELDRILALDADTIITGRMSDLWDLDMEDAYLAGVAEKELSKQKGYPYINMGLGFWNLGKVREDHLDDKMISDLNTIRFTWLEQDCINEACKGHTIELDPGYSFSWYAKKTENIRMHHFCADPDWRNEELVKAYRDIPWGL